MFSKVALPALLLALARTLPAEDGGRGGSPDPAAAFAGSATVFEQFWYRGSLPDADTRESEQYTFSLRFAASIGSSSDLRLEAEVPILHDQPYWKVDEFSPYYRHGREYPDFLIRQNPWITADTGRMAAGHDYMTDLEYDFTAGTDWGSGTTTRIGIHGVLPTSEDQSNRRHQYLLGPDLTAEFAIGNARLGARLIHLTDVAGDARFATNETTLQLLASWDAGGGWTLLSRPTVLYDWEADRDNHLLLPIGGGFSKPLAFGPVTLRFTAEYYTYLETASRLGVSRMLRISIAPVLAGK